MKLIRIGIMLILIICLCGCWDKRELEDKGIILAMGVDYEDGEYIFTYSVSAPTKDTTMDAGKIQVCIGKNFEEAREKQMHQSNKIPSYEHLKAIVFSRELVMQEKEFVSLLLEIEDNYMIARNIKVFVTDNTAGEIIEYEKTIEKSIGLYLDKQMDNNFKSKNDVELGNLLKKIDAGSWNILTLTLSEEELVVQ